MKKFLFLPILLITAIAAAASVHDAPGLFKVKHGAAVKHAPLQLVKDGKLTFAIVRDMSVEKDRTLDQNRKSITIAVNALKDAFKRTTGQIPVVLDAKSSEIAKYPVIIAVGKSAVTDKLGVDPMKLPRDGFMVKSFDKVIVIAGWDGSVVDGTYTPMDWTRYRFNGTAHGAYDFCERYLGMRYYYPGIGIYAPQVKNLTVAPVNYSDAPYFRDRYNWAYMGQFARYRKTKWPWKNIPNNAANMQYPWRMAINTRFVFGHSPNPLSVAKAFPDKIDTYFYKDKSGFQYYRPKAHIGNYFDITNPQFTKDLVAWYKKYLETNGKWSAPWAGVTKPNSEYLLFGQCDTFIDDLENEYTKPFLYKETSQNRNRKLSDVYANFYINLAKALKKEVPGAKVAMMLYHNYTDIPFKKWDYPDNIETQLCVGSPVFIRSKIAQRNWKRIYGRWSSTLKRPVNGYWYGVQRNNFTRLLQGSYVGETAKFLKNELSRDGVMLDMGSGDHEFYCSYYTAYRSLWNPDFDTHAAIREHWNLLYGPKAGPKLQAFYELIKNRWENTVIPSLTSIAATSVDNDKLYAGFNLEVIKKLETLLKEAQNAVPEGSIERMRVDFFAKPWAKEFASARAYMTTSIPEARAAKIKSREVMKVDGKLDEPVWKRAKALPLANVKGNGEIPEGNPEPRIVWNKDGLYIGFSVQGKPNMVKGDLWNRSDSIEFFLSPGEKKEAYYQFVISPANDTAQGYRCLKPVETRFDGKWKHKDIKFAAFAADNMWSAEIFIPWHAMSVKVPRTYSSCFANIVYNKYRKASSSFSLTMGNNHNYALFGRIKFMGIGD